MNTIEKVSSMNKNLYVLYYAARLAKFTNNQKIFRLSKEFSEIDSIENFPLFRKKIETMIDSDNLKKLVYPNSENSMYGHLHAFCDYAGIPYEATPFIHVEHGVDFPVDDVPDFKFENSTIMMFQSNYKERMIHEKTPLKPVFAVGPYIHYARPYYDREKQASIKKRLGKTVVIYLSHTWEKVSLERDYIEYKNIIKRLKDDFESVVICLYWSDCSKDLIDNLSREENIHFVSAGFRGDPRFLSRTRTILELADVVAGNDIGTFIGYALYLKKPILYLHTNDKVIKGVASGKINVAEKNKTRIIAALESNNSLELQNIYNEFWGGNCIRSRDEMYSILSFADLIARRSLGFKSKFSKVTKKLLTVETKGLLLDSVRRKEGKNE